MYTQQDSPYLYTAGAAALSRRQKRAKRAPFRNSKKGSLERWLYYVSASNYSGVDRLMQEGKMTATISM